MFNFSKGAYNKIYWKCIHVMCASYDAIDMYEKNMEVMTAMLGFIKLFAVLIPNKMWSQWMSDFIELNDRTKMEVLSNPTMKIYNSTNPPMPLEHYIMNQKSSCALEWSWTLHEYINFKRRKNGENIESVSLSDVRANYNMKYITKDAWGRPMWFVLHTFSLYSEPLTPQHKKVWKAFLSSLQYVLPCPVCKEHYKENIISLDVDYFLSSPQKLFEWTWRLHNTVNLSKSYKTRAISLQEAQQIYSSSDNDTLTMIFL